MKNKKAEISLLKGVIISGLIILGMLIAWALFWTLPFR